MANYLGRNQDEVFQVVRQNVINFFSDQLDSQILLHYKTTLQRKFFALSNFTSTDIEHAINEIDSTFSSIDKQQIYDRLDAEFREIV